MKAKLIFDLDDESDKERYDAVMKSQQYLCALRQFSAFLRHKRKYCEPNDAEKKYLEETIDAFCLSLKFNNVEL